MIQLRNHAIVKSAKKAVRKTPSQEGQARLIWFFLIQPIIPHKMKTTVAPKPNVIRLIVSILFPEGCVCLSVIDIPESEEFIHLGH